MVDRQHAKREIWVQHLVQTSICLTKYGIRDVEKIRVANWVFFWSTRTGRVAPSFEPRIVNVEDEVHSLRDVVNF